MSRVWFMVLLLGLCSPMACGDDDTTTGNNNANTNNNDAGASLDGTTSGDGGVEIECTPTIDQCPTGLDCLCCGAIGPMNICICSIACDGDGDCTHPDLPHCNKPGPTVAGICTTEQFNCCWACQ